MTPYWPSILVDGRWFVPLTDSGDRFGEQITRHLDVAADECLNRVFDGAIDAVVRQIPGEVEGFTYR